MFETLGSAAIVLALVAALNKGFTLSPRWSMFVGALCSLVVVIVQAAAAKDVPVDWSALPMEALMTWLTAMGTWTGGKVAIKGRAGGEPKP